MDVTIFSDPSKVGPGMWASLHVDAIYATTDVLKNSFITNTNAKCDNFRCKTCQPHFRKFIDTHPFNEYWNIRDIKGRDVGFFKWTWELHNEVNKRLNKYQPTFDEAYEFWSNNDIGACFNCGSPPEVPELRSRAIPPILTLYRDAKDIKPQPFRLIPRT